MMQTRRCGLGATPISSRAERTPAADWRTAPPHRYADRIHRLPRQCPSKCPSSVSDSKLPFMCGSVQPINIGIGGFGSPWKGPPAPPDMRAPLCLSQAGLPISDSKRRLSPLFSSFPLFFSFFLSIFSLRFYFDPDIQGPLPIDPSVDTSLTGFPSPQSCSSLVLFVLSTTTDISLCCIVTVSFYIQSSNSSRTCSFTFFLYISFLISLCFLRVPARGSWKKKHPVWSLSTHYLPLDFNPFPRIGFAFAVLSSSLSSKA